MKTFQKHKKKPKLETSINLKAKNIAELIIPDYRIKSVARTPKDHKPDFRQSPSCRLINPVKNDFGKVIELIIEKINENNFGTSF